MKILVLNAGSSSLKSSLYECSKNKQKALAHSLIDGIGSENCKFTFKSSKKNIGQKKKIKSHKAALKLALELLTSHSSIQDLKEIDAIANRVVHGGEKYSEPVKIGKRVIEEIEKLSNLAPLHNPVNLDVIKAAKEVLPRTPQIAIFDTAFHQSMPEEAFLYALPYSLYKKENIRRYGFHGTSHKYVNERAAKILKKKKLKTISVHLGNGSSITACKNGESIDTSMGFTPLEGIPMGTRCGSIDPAISFHLQKNLKMKANDVDTMLNKESGLKGLSEISNDMREIYAAYKENDERAVRTIEHLCYQAAKHIAGYSAALKGFDTLVFTATMGEKAFYLRAKICEHLEHFGLQLDKKANKNYKEGEEIISTKESKITVLVIPTNEELQMAKETFNLLS